MAIAAIYQLRQITKLPLIGIGGAKTAEDVVEFLLAGASAVQVYTAAQLEGPKVFAELRKELPALLEKLKAPYGHFRLRSDPAQSKITVASECVA